ncbi:MAG TPA: hypothetical protein VJC18_04515, partial [bacterium]|nr:hypothetical protein [bacterium]
MNNDSAFVFWLDKFSALPAVTGWSWTPSVRDEFESLFRSRNICACFDKDTLLLGARSSFDWQNQFEQTRIV